MPTLKNKPTKLKPRPRTKSQETPKPSDLEEYIREADEVQILANTQGWKILERDLLEYQSGIASRIAYLDPSKPEQREARILFIAVDKVFNLINDYAENKTKAQEMLEKLNNPDTTVTMDVDNEA